MSDRKSLGPLRVHMMSWRHDDTPVAILLPSPEISSVTMFDSFLPLQEFTYFENAFRIPVTPLTHKKASAVHHIRSGVSKSADDDGWIKHPSGHKHIHKRNENDEPCAFVHRRGTMSETCNM